MSEEKNQTAAAPVATAQPAAAVVAKNPTAAGAKIPVAQKANSPAKLAILQRLENGGEDGLPAIIRQLSGGDDLFADKFVVCVKNQVNKGWKQIGNNWINPFQTIPVQSVLECLYKCASRKILPDGYNAYLVPYNGKNPTCSLQIDYKGLIDCAIREGIIIDADAKEVRENDDFVWNCGEVERFTFDFRKPRGKVCGVCAWAILPNGRKKWHWMDAEEIAEIRSCVRDTGIWDKWATEMAKKSAIRRLFKTLRNSPAVNDLLELDNDNFEDVRQTASAPASAPRSRRQSSRVPVGGYTAPAAQIEAPAAPVEAAIEVGAKAEEIPAAALDDPFAL